MKRLKIYMVIAALCMSPFLSPSEIFASPARSHQPGRSWERDDFNNLGLSDFALNVFQIDETDTPEMKKLKESRFYYMQGQMLLVKNDYPGALKEFEHAARIDTSSAKIQLQIAKCQFLMNQYPKTEKICHEVLKENPQYTPALALLAKNYEMTNNYKEAEKTYNQILDLEPNNLEALQSLGPIYYQHFGNLDKTVEVYERILKLNPKDIMSLVMLGSAYAIRGDVDKGIEYYSRAVHYRPNLVSSYINLAKIFQEARNFEGAQRVYYEAILTNPSNTEVHKAFQSFLHLQALRKFSDKKAAEMQEKGITTTTLTLQQLLKDKELQGFIEKELLDGYRLLAEEKATSNTALIEFYADMLMRYEHYDEATYQYKRILRIDPKYYKAHVALGNIALLQGDKKAVVDAFDSAIAVNPDNMEVYSEIGATYLDRKDYQKALELYKKAITIKPDEEKLYVILFNIYQELKMYREGEEILKNFIKKHPDQPDLLILLGDFYRRRDRYEEAIDAFKRAYELKKSSRAYASIIITLLLETDRLREAVKFADDATEHFKKNKEFLTLTGLTFCDFGQFDEALRYLEMLKEADPSSLSAYLLMASIYNRKKDYKKATELMTGLYEKLPKETNKTEYFEALASVYSEQHNTAKAEEAFRQAVSLEPGKSGIYQSWTLLLNREKRYEDAKHVLENAFKHIDKNSEQGMFLEAQVLTGQKNFDRAEMLYHLLLKASPDNTEYLYNQGVMYYEAKRYDEAEKCFRMVIQLSSDHADAYNTLGYMFAERGINLDEAMTLIKKAIYLRPGAGYMVDSLGWVYFKKGQYDTALKYLLRAEKSSTEDATLFDHLGDTYKELGQKDKAHEYWNRAYKMDQEIKGLKEKLKQ
jgi:tetratricopeptide (TPR) repeat protein